MTAVERAAEVLARHRLLDDLDDVLTCSCDWLTDTSGFLDQIERHASHQAAALAAEGLLVADDPGPTVQALYGDEL